MTAGAIRSLEECGFHQPEHDPTGDSRALRMPRFVRAYLQRHLRARSPETLTWEHAWLGGRPFKCKPIAEQLEIHFHAVHGGQIDRAIETARYYGSDLREIAFQRSRLASQERNEQEQRRLYVEAARIYTIIVEKYDASDAYAWEYRGYNLARAYPEREPLPDAVREEILCAYQNAVEREPNNPLYHGRLLSFRVRLGEDVVAAFSERMSAYLEQFEGKPEAVSYFAEPVLSALERLGGDAQRARIEQDWGGALVHLRRRRLPLDL